MACFSIKYLDEILFQNPSDTELIIYFEIWIKLETQMPHGRYFYEFDSEKCRCVFFAANQLPAKVLWANLEEGKRRFTDSKKRICIYYEWRI